MRSSTSSVELNFICCNRSMDSIFLPWKWRLRVANDNVQGTTENEGKFLFETKWENKILNSMYCTTFIAFWHMDAIRISNVDCDVGVWGKYMTRRTSNGIASISEGRNLVIRRLLSYLLFSVIFSPTLYRIEGKMKIQHHLEYDRWFSPSAIRRSTILFFRVKLWFG